MTFGPLTPRLKIPDVTTFGTLSSTGVSSSLAVLADGRLVSVYSGMERTQFDVRYQLLSPEGFSLSGGMSLPGAKPRTAEPVYVTATADGGFAITAGATVQRFDASGAASLAPFTQRGTTSRYMDDANGNSVQIAVGSELAALGNDLVVGNVGSNSVLLTRYDANNAVATSASFVTHGYSGLYGTSYTPSDVQIASHQGATAESTRIVVAWYQVVAGFRESSSFVGLRVLDGNFNPVSIVLDADSQTPGSYSTDGKSYNPDVTFLKDGSFVLAWIGSGIFSRHYTADGAAISTTKVSGTGSSPVLTATSDGGYTIAWTDDSGGHIAQYDAHDQAISGNVALTVASTVVNSRAAYPMLATAQLPDGAVAVAGYLGLQLFSPTQTVTNGNNADNAIAGTAGDDVISGLTGNDTIDGNAGRDVLYGNEGNDVLRGGAGSDVLVGGTGNDTIDGGDGFDVIALDKAASTYFFEPTSTGFNLWNGTEKDTVTNVEGFYGSDGTTYTLADFRKVSFNALAYIASYPDLENALGDNASAGYQHYLNYGKAEGRTIKFDPVAYLAANPDLAIAYGDDQVAAARHYIDIGRFEGRKTSGFQALEYGASNPDLARAFGTDVAALTMHYLQFGAREGRALASFDPLIYGASNPDLAKGFGTNSAALLDHYLTHGVFEGRSTTGFDALLYAASNDDLARLYGSDAHSALLDYLNTGAKQGRVTSGFDSVAYLLSNSDLAGAGPQGALLHWLDHGADEGRIGDALFGREQGTAHDFVNYDAKAALEIASDHDWFQIGMVAGYGADIHLGGVSSGKGTLSDGWLQLYDESGKLLAVSHGAAGQSDADLLFTPDTTGRYFVVVAGETDHETGTYDLSVTGLPYVAPHVEMAHADYLG